MDHLAKVGIKNTESDKSIMKHSMTDEKSAKNQFESESDSIQETSDSTNHSIKKAPYISQCVPVIMISTALLFCALLFFNMLAADPAKSYGLFKRGISNVSAAYPLPITPAGWAFSIWGLIYLAQLSWIVYGLAALCRVTPNGPAYLHPPILTAQVLMIFNFTSILNVAWLFLWDRLMFIACALFLTCQLLSLGLTLACVSDNVVKFREDLIDEGRATELRFLTLCLVNGLGVYAAWVAVATCLNLGTVLAYKLPSPLPPESAALVVLAVLMTLYLIYVALDVFCLERFTRFLVSPYITVVWAMAAVVSKNWDPQAVSSVFAAVLLAFFCLSALIKISMACHKARSLEAYQYRMMKAATLSRK